MSIWNKSMIGLELDSEEIRAVEITGSRKKPSVVAWGSVRIPEGTVKDGKVLNPKLLFSHFEKLMNENGFKGKEIMLGVNNQDLLVRLATFPKIPADKISNMIRFQAQDHIPVPMEELELDYVLLDEKKNMDGEFINVLLVGARKRMLNDFLEVFAGSKYVIKEIDSTMLALGRAALIESHYGTFVLVCFNRDIANILIFKEGYLRMARSIAIKQAPAWISSEDALNQGLEATVIADILYNEIRSSVTYYTMQSGENIEGMYVLGHGDIQKKVAQRLSETIGARVVAMKPYSSISVKGGKKPLQAFNSSEYVASISLAIRGLGE